MTIFNHCGMDIYRMVDMGIRKIPTFAPRLLGTIPRISLGKFEAEEVAMDLLTLCVEVREWVGVSWRDYALKKQTRIVDLMVKKTPKTIGIMTRFPQSIGALSRVVVMNPTVFGGYSESTTIHGFPISVINGVNMLIDNGLVGLQQLDREDVIHPTIELVEFVQKK